LPELSPAASKFGRSTAMNYVATADIYVVGQESGAQP
jgi:hypothetical protein